jgi:hypothetical protein
LRKDETMLKKVIVGTLLVGLIGILVFGAVNRTLDKTVRVTAQGEGQGRGRTSEELAQGQGFGRDHSSEELARVQGNGRGRSAEDVQVGSANGRGAGQGGAAERQYPNYENAPEAWMMIEGIVAQVPGAGVDLVIETSEGELVQIGTGPMDLVAQGFALQAGESVQVNGYWEGNEFKAAQLTRLTTGQTLSLRDEFGRPAWAGSGRNAQQAEQGGKGSQEAEWGGNGSRGGQQAPRDQAGVGQAKVDGWVELQGSVVSADAAALVVLTTDGKEIELEGRSWSFAQELGFSAQVGDELTLIGFYEGDELEVALIKDATNGLAVALRDENGRPLWAGRGRRGL